MSGQGEARDPGTDDPRDLLAAYALDAVDDLERRAVERLVASDPDAARELAGFRESAARLGAAVASDPPADLRASVLAAVTGMPQERLAGAEAPAPPAFGAHGRPPVSPAAPVSRRADRDARTRRPHGVTWLGLAAAVAIALAVPGTLAWQQHERAVQAEAASTQLTQVLADPGAVVVRGEVTGGGQALAVLTDERALLVASGLPSTAEGTTYQLWSMHDGVPVPAGLFEPRAGSAQVLAGTYVPGDGLAVSVEPDGGSQAPTTTPVVVLLPG